MCALAALALVACTSTTPSPSGGAGSVADRTATPPAAPISAATPARDTAPPETPGNGGAGTPGNGGAATPGNANATFPAVGGTPGATCRLVTQQEVEHATNLPYTPGEMDGADCTYNGDFSKENFTAVVIGTDFSNTVQAARIEFQDGHDVSGLGHAAYWSPSLTELWVDLGGNRTLQVQLVLFDVSNGQDYLPVAQGLAQIALSRL
jgi:hypothetical protein